MDLLKLLWKFLLAFAVLSLLTHAAEEDEEEADEDAEDADSPEEIMKRMDKDGDGKLSMEEILSDPESEPDEQEKSQLDKHFKKAEVDGDGKVDLEQLAELIRSFE